MYYLALNSSELFPKGRFNNDITTDNSGTTPIVDKKKRENMKRGGHALDMIQVLEGSVECYIIQDGCLPGRVRVEDPARQLVVVN
jgi:hypothetical protein